MSTLVEVAEQLLDDLDVYLRLQRERRGAVPEIVQPDRWQPGCGD